MNAKQHFIQFVAASVMSLFCVGAANAQQVLRIQALFNPGDSVFQHIQGCLADISQSVDDRIRFEVLPVGAVVGPTGTLDAVKVGVLDGHFTYSPLWTGIEAAFPLITDLPGGHDDANSVQAFFYEDKGLQLLRRAYDRFGLHVAGILPAGVESMPSRKPINSVNDLKGMKIRVPSGITATVFQRLGAAPVTLPMSDTYGALEKGVVDAADLGPLWWNDDIGIHQFAKYELHPSMHSNLALDLSFNKKKWRSLPPDVRTVIESGMRTCGAQFIAAHDEANRKAEIRVQEKGVTLTSWSAADRNTFRSVSREVWEEFAARSGPLAKEALAAQVEYLKAQGVLE